MDAYEEMKGYDGPVFLIHGTADSLVNISCSRRLKEIYPNCRYVEIEGGVHGFKGEHDRQACKELKQFMIDTTK